MEGNNGAITTIDEYIAQYQDNIQEKLQAIRKVIREAAPEATEKISWAMPTFYLHYNVVHFAAHKNHIGMYPGANGIETFRQELAPYQTSKGAVQFPYAKPLPAELIARIVRFRVAENLALAEEKKRKKQ